MSKLFALEWDIQKQSIKSMFVLIIIIIGGNIFNKNVDLFSILSVMLAVMLSLMSIETIFRDKFHLTLFSLGVKKSDLVKMKFITSVFYIVIANILGIVVCVGVTKILNWKMSVNYESFLISASMSIVYVGLLLLVSFVIGYKYHKIANIILLASGAVILLNINANDIKISFENLNIWILIGAIVSYTLMYIITLIIYRKKDINND